MFNRNQVVRFMIGRESYGLDIGTVQEIVTVPDITHVPDTPSFLEGIINLRGKIVSVIDLRKRFGMNGGTRNRKNRILITEIDNKVVGLVVDEVSEVLRMNYESVEPPPAVVSAIGAEYITGVGKLEESIILMLDLAKVLSPEEFDNLKEHDAALDEALHFGETKAQA